MLCLLAIIAYSQATSSATITATVVKSVTISKSVESDFGNITAVIVTGSVAVSPVGVYSKAGSLRLPVSTGTITVASYASGSFGYNYTFDLPNQPFTLKVGTKKMKVDSYDTNNPSNFAEPGLIAGVYVAFTPYNVTVNYN